ncbi:hypothetical protein FRC03_002712 [Tulasnella sp. 419]|nr:hypothetical protein FRC03_002712 [Tulasnella sp. 419]
MEDATRILDHGIPVRRRSEEGDQRFYISKLATLRNVLRASGGGRLEPSIGAGTEVTQSYRDPARMNQDSYLPDLSLSLQELATDLGRA